VGSPSSADNSLVRTLLRAEALEIYRSSGDQLAEGRTLWQLARHLGRNGRHVEGLTSARQAVAVLEQVPPCPELALAYVQLSGAYALTVNPHAITWAAKAISLGAEVGCLQAVYDGLNNIGTIEVSRGELAGLSKLERSRDLAGQAGDSAGVARAHLHICWTLTLRRHWSLLGQYLAPAIAYCLDHGQELWLDMLRSCQLEADLATGRWDQAATDADAILAGAAPAIQAGGVTALLVLATIRARRGEQGYWPLLDQALKSSKRAGGARLLPNVAAARAEAAWLEGRIADVLTEATIPAGPFHELHPVVAAELRYWRWRAGGDSGALEDLPEPYRMLIAGDRQGASRWWREHGSRYEAALALSGSGDVAELRAAIGVLDSLGARPAVAILVRELRALGERRVPGDPRPAPSPHPAGLTAREGEVLLLLAAGMRNAEIAAHLVVSPRTVDHHVSAVLRKLKVSTRSQAITAAIRLGLVQA